MALNVINAVSTLFGLRTATGNTTAIGGPEGEQFASEIHGPWYHRARSGQLFVGSTPATGGLIGAQGATPKSPVLLNPTGSAVNLEIAEITVGLNTATAVIGSLGLCYQAPVTTPTGTATLGGLTSTMINGGFSDSSSLFYTAFKFVGTPSFLKTLGLSFGTTTAGAGPIASLILPQGMLSLAPGSALGLVSTAAQTQLFVSSITYARVPV